MNRARAGEEALVATGMRIRRGRREILAGVDLRLRRGEIVALLGPNGAGKSTLIRGLAGLAPLTAGTVEVDGRLAATTQEATLANRSALANVELGLAWWGVARAERRRRATEALAALGAGHLAAQPAASLSGGEARRVHLARALAVRPEVLLLDEPFAGLDTSARAELLYDASGALRSEERSTLVVVHDRAEAWALADRVLLLLDGRVAASGPPQEVLDRPRSVAAARFLGFDGELREGAEILMTRPGQVALDPDGPLRGRVARRIPVEDGVRLELELADGTLVALSPQPGPRVGETVALRILGGVRFSAAAPDREDAAGSGE